MSECTPEGKPLHAQLTWWDKIWTYPWAIGVVLGDYYRIHKAINAEVRENISWCLDDDVIADVTEEWTRQGL